MQQEILKFRVRIQEVVRAMHQPDCRAKKRWRLKQRLNKLWWKVDTLHS